ncbi:MAG: hypothetical protein K2N48_06360 [Muribaculaceae bacterium]|nr:hypothetical protein [Muribaculaceae bacterium]
MKALTNYFEGLLDADFDIKDDALSIANNAKKIKSDLYVRPNTQALQCLRKSIRYDNDYERPANLLDQTRWSAGWSEVEIILKWICSKPMSWVTNKLTGEFYVAFCNQLLTDYGAKRKWRILIEKFTLMNTTYKVYVQMLRGQSWENLVVAAIYT